MNTYIFTHILVRMIIQVWTKFARTMHKYIMVEKGAEED